MLWPKVQLNAVCPPSHLLLGDAASGLPSKLAGGRLFLCAAGWNNTAGVALWARRRERFSSCGGISSASTHPDSLQLTVGWCWRRRLRPACARRWPCAWRQWAIRVHGSRGELRPSGQGCWDDDEIERAGSVKEIRFLLTDLYVEDSFRIILKRMPSV